MYELTNTVPTTNEESNRTEVGMGVGVGVGTCRRYYLVGGTYMVCVWVGVWHVQEVGIMVMKQ